MIKLQTLDKVVQSSGHEGAISVDGLDDLFQWASEMVTDSTDPRSRRVREQKLRRNVLDIIQRNKEIEAGEKFSQEINYLQKRVMALLQIINEKIDENTSLKHIIVAQYFAMSRMAELENEVKQLQSLTWYRDEAEAERKHLMDGLAKLKKERDFLDELLTVNELENTKLARALNQLQAEVVYLKNRKWWHRFWEFSKMFK